MCVEFSVYVIIRVLTGAAQPLRKAVIDKRDHYWLSSDSSDQLLSDRCDRTLKEAAADYILLRAYTVSTSYRNIEYMVSVFN